MRPHDAVRAITVGARGIGLERSPSGLPAATPDSISLITGASSGLGAQIANELAARGHSLALAARRKKRLNEIAAALRKTHGVRVESIVSDVSDPASRDAMLARIEELELVVDILVNNAGYGTSGRFRELPAETETAMVGVNVEAVVALCAATVPPMAARGRGAILNVASTIAFQPVPSVATYAATKAFVLAFSEALHTELSPDGVTVTALCPGAMRTEFLAGAGIEQGATRLPKQLWIDPNVAAKEGIRGLERRERVVVPGIVNRAGTLTGRHMPRWLLLRLLGRLADGIGADQLAVRSRLAA